MRVSRDPSASVTKPRHGPPHRRFARPPRGASSRRAGIRRGKNRLLWRPPTSPVGSPLPLPAPRSPRKAIGRRARSSTAAVRPSRRPHPGGQASTRLGRAVTISECPRPSRCFSSSNPSSALPPPGNCRRPGSPGPRSGGSSAGRWRLVLPHVVATFTGQLDLRQRLVAAQLLAGPGGMISGPHRGSMARPDLPSGRCGARRGAAPPAAAERGFVMVRRTRMPDARPWNRPPLVVVSRPRAVASAARAARRADCGRGCRPRGRATTARPAGGSPARARGRATGGQRPAARSLAAAERGAWSVPEAELGHLLRSSRVLPTAWFNPDLFAADGTPTPPP